MRSTDDGITWTIRQLPDRWRFKAAALSGTDVYVVGDTSEANALLEIANCGSGEAKTIKTFAYKTDGAANGVAVDSSGRVYVTTVFHARGRMLCSKEQGLNLSVCDDQPTVPFYGVFVGKNGHIFAAAGYQGAAGGRVRGSSDHGATWKTLGQNLGTIVYGIWGDPSGQRLVATGSGEIYSSSDSGSTWRTTPALAMSGGSMMLGTGDAPYVPNDFASWIFGNPETGTVLITGGGMQRGSNSQSPLKVKYIDGVSLEAAVATGGGHWVGVGDSGRITRSTDDGLTWSQISKDVLTEGDAFVDIESDGHSVFVLRKRRFWRSDDGGATFIPLGAEVLADLPITPRDFVSFAVDSSAVLIPRPAAKTIARSVDRGLTFKEISLKLGSGQTVAHVWNGPPGIVYASGTGGALFRSQDDGLSFAPLALGSGDNLAAGYARDHDVYLVGAAAAGSGHAFHSADDGKTWTTVPLDLEPYGIGVAGTDIYVVSRYGKIVRSRDSGKTWAITVDLDCGDVTGLVTQNARIDLICGDGHLFTSTDHAATFKKEPVAAQVELLFPDAHGGLLAASSRGYSQYLHFF